MVLPFIEVKCLTGSEDSTYADGGGRVGRVIISSGDASASPPIIAIPTLARAFICLLISLSFIELAYFLCKQYLMTAFIIFFIHLLFFDRSSVIDSSLSLSVFSALAARHTLSSTSDHLRQDPRRQINKLNQIRNRKNSSVVIKILLIHVHKDPRVAHECTLHSLYSSYP